MRVNRLDQRCGLIGQGGQSRIALEHDRPLAVDDDEHAFRHRQQPVIRIIGADHFSVGVGEQGQVVETVLVDKPTMGFDTVPADAEDFDVAGCEFLYVLLKLNKFRRSVFGVVLGVKGDQGTLVPFQYRAQGHHRAVLVRQGEIGGQVADGRGCSPGAVTGTTGQYEHHEHQGHKWFALHGRVSFCKAWWLIGAPVFSGTVCARRMYCTSFNCAQLLIAQFCIVFKINR